MRGSTYAVVQGPLDTDDRTEEDRNRDGKITPDEVTIRDMPAKKRMDYMRATACFSISERWEKECNDTKDRKNVESRQYRNWRCAGTVPMSNFSDLALTGRQGEKPKALPCYCSYYSATFERNRNKYLTTGVRVGYDRPPIEGSEALREARNKAKKEMTALENQMRGKIDFSKVDVKENGKSVENGVKTIGREDLRGLLGIPEQVARDYECAVSNFEILSSKYRVMENTKSRYLAISPANACFDSFAQVERYHAYVGLKKAEEQYNEVDLQISKEQNRPNKDGEFSMGRHRMSDDQADRSEAAYKKFIAPAKARVERAEARYKAMLEHQQKDREALLKKKQDDAAAAKPNPLPKPTYVDPCTAWFDYSTGDYDQRKMYDVDISTGTITFPRDQNGNMHPEIQDKFLGSLIEGQKR
jgi:hypothetical protein